jgi:hypothetical protein
MNTKPLLNLIGYYTKSDFIAFCQSGNLEKLKKLHHAVSNERFEYFLTALQSRGFLAAVTSRHHPVVSFLLEKASPETRDRLLLENNLMAFLISFDNQDKSMTSVLLRHASNNVLKAFFESPLLLAYLSCSADECFFLLQHSDNTVPQMMIAASDYKVIRDALMYHNNIIVKEILKKALTEKCHDTPRFKQLLVSQEVVNLIHQGGQEWHFVLQQALPEFCDAIISHKNYQFFQDAIDSHNLPLVAEIIRHVPPDKDDLSPILKEVLLSDELMALIRQGGDEGRLIFQQAHQECRHIIISDKKYRLFREALECDNIPLIKEILKNILTDKRHLNTCCQKIFDSEKVRIFFAQGGEDRLCLFQSALPEYRQLMIASRNYALFQLAIDYKNTSLMRDILESSCREERHKIISRNNYSIIDSCFYFRDYQILDVLLDYIPQQTLYNIAMQQKPELFCPNARLDEKTYNMLRMLINRLTQEQRDPFIERIYWRIFTNTNNLGYGRESFQQVRIILLQQASPALRLKMISHVYSYSLDLYGLPYEKEMVRYMLEYCSPDLAQKILTSNNYLIFNKAITNQELDLLQIIVQKTSSDVLETILRNTQAIEMLANNTTNLYVVEILDLLFENLTQKSRDNVIRAARSYLKQDVNNRNRSDIQSCLLKYASADIYERKGYYAARNPASYFGLR